MSVFDIHLRKLFVDALPWTCRNDQAHRLAAISTITSGLRLGRGWRVEELETLPAGTKPNTSHHRSLGGERGVGRGSARRSFSEGRESAIVSQTTLAWTGWCLFVLGRMSVGACVPTPSLNLFPDISLETVLVWVFCWPRFFLGLSRWSFVGNAISRIPLSVPLCCGCSTVWCPCYSQLAPQAQVIRDFMVCWVLWAGL